MIPSKISLSVAGVAMIATMLLGAASVSAAGLGLAVVNTQIPTVPQPVTPGIMQGDVSASGSASAGGVTPSVSASAQASLNAGATLAAVIARGDADITARIDALNALAARVQSMSNVSATEKATLTSELNTNVTGLTGLQGQIDANTDVTSARTEDQSIFTAYRIYALVIPQGWILASADRIDTITGLMTVLSTKLQTRITADESASGSASASLTALSNTVADMNAKIADANTQSAAAQARVSSLVPDQGNQAVITSNHDALVAARADTRVGTQDLVAARADITTVIQGLQAFEASASASGSASGSTN